MDRPGYAGKRNPERNQAVRVVTNRTGKVAWTDDLTYKSVIKNNVWSVSGYPQGWEVVPPP